MSIYVKTQLELLKGRHTNVANQLFSVKLGDSCYHGLCELGASISVIPYSLYLEI
jgi:hypothetical protein